MAQLDIKWTNLERALNEFADYFIQQAKQNLESNGSNASRDLYNSFEKIIEIGEDYFSVKVSLEDYWYYVENGRGPGKFPPPDAIRKWIEIKPLTPAPGTNGKVPSVVQLTFLVSRKIANEGTDGKPFFEPAQRAALAMYEEAINRAIEADVEAFINEAVMKRFEDALT